MKLKIAVLTILALGATALTAFSQTNISLSGTQPYYSITNIVLSGAGTLVANDPIPGATTFSYLNSTNAAGAQIVPVGVVRSRYVSFGLTVVTTNTAGAAYSAIIQGSTGGGDWQSLTPSLVATATASNTGGTGMTNTTYDTGGLILFRLKSIQSAEAATTNATATVSFSSKAGI